MLFSPTAQLQHLDRLSERLGTWRTSELNQLHSQCSAAALLELFQSLQIQNRKLQGIRNHNCNSYYIKDGIIQNKLCKI